MKLTSPQTTLAGVGAILTALGSVFTGLSSEQGMTAQEWVMVATAITTGWGLIAARDNKTTSEQAGCKSPGVAP